jgi:hypothetical protein
MSTIDGLAVVAFFFALGVLIAALPGILIGSIVGKQVRNKVASLIACLAIDVLVVSLLVHWILNSRPPSPEDGTGYVVFIGGGSIALAIPTLLGWWLVRRKLVEV